MSSNCRPILAKRYTFYRNQNSRRERHHLRGTPRGRVFGKELTVNLIYHTKIIAGHHENGCLYHITNAAAGLFQNQLDVLKTLPGLIFKAITNNLAGMEVQTGSTGYENKFFGYYRLWKGLTHPGSLWCIEVFSSPHIVIFFKTILLIREAAYYKYKYKMDVLDE
jgi:hypothetical protein